MTRYVDPIAWHQSLGYARQACARVFRDGGSASDALRAFDITVCEVKAGGDDIGWAKAVELIAHRLAAQSQPLRHAA